MNTTVTKATRRKTVEIIARELALQAGRDEGLWELHFDEAAKLAIKENGRALELVRAYNARKRQGASRV